MGAALQEDYIVNLGEETQRQCLSLDSEARLIRLETVEFGSRPCKTSLPRLTQGELKRSFIVFFVHSSYK